MSRALTRTQVLAWRVSWSHSDKELIAYVLDSLEEADYYETTTNGYVGARVAGKVAVYVLPGYLEWPSRRAAERVDATRFPGGIQSDGTTYWYALSSFRHRGESMPTFEESSEPCSTCWIVPSVTGACGCD